MAKKKNRTRWILYPSLLLLTLIIIGGLFFLRLDLELQERLQQGQIIQPTIFYASTSELKKGMVFNKERDLPHLRSIYRERQNGQKILSGDFAWLTAEECKQSTLTDPQVWSSFTDPTTFQTAHCLTLFPSKDEARATESYIFEVIQLNSNNEIIGVFAGTPPVEVEKFILPPAEIVQYLGTEPIRRVQTPLSKTPTECLNAVMAIEDSNFLDHRGVRPTGILRALLTNLTKGKAAQGGSTITQQLVKNYFLSPEKTFKRKFLEFFMALDLEARTDKDLILETYLNVIYMGQQGSFQIRGYGAASRYYFNKGLQDLNLPECALMAAVVNSPGLFNPWAHPDKAKKRRTLVLQKMSDLKIITEAERKIADAVALPGPTVQADIYSTAPYFIQASLKQLTQLGFENIAGLKIFTSLDIYAQEAAQKSVNQRMLDLETSNKTIRTLKEDKKKILESLLVSADVSTGRVRALVGGRSFKKTQYNRAIEAMRQVGSTFKPLVYLTALMNSAPDGSAYTPITEVEDKPFTYKYDGQAWHPENYGKNSFGKIPMFFGLKESLNLATAKIGIAVGLDKIIDTAKALGIKSPLKPLPSLTLGAFEIQPLEMLQAYLTLARLGSYLPLTWLEAVQSPDGTLLYQHKIEPSPMLPPETVSVLVGMMKQTLISGTAKLVYNSGFQRPAAGKTGTTNDNHDSWFIGFTPEHLALVWTGYDDNTPTGLTGASGSLPTWISYMKTVMATYVVRDFPWNPEINEVRDINVSDLVNAGLYVGDKPDMTAKISLVFKK